MLLSPSGAPVCGADFVNDAYGYSTVKSAGKYGTAPGGAILHRNIPYNMKT